MPDETVENGPDDDGDESDFDSLPGRPIGPGEIDPELVKLSRPRPRVGVVTSAAIVAFCGYLMFSLRGDLVFSRASGSPAAASIADVVAGTVGNESYVRIEAMPDRTLAVRVGTGEGDPGARATPLWGSHDRVWILEPGTTYAALATAGVYEGRLKSVDSLPFGSALRSHVSKRAQAPRYVSARAVREALSAGSDLVKQPSGDTVQVTAQTRVDIEQTRQDRTIVEVFATNRHQTSDAWTVALTEAGIVEPGTNAVAEDEDETWSYEVGLSVDDVREKLEKAKLTAARASPVVERREAIWGELSGPGGMLGTDVEWVAVHVSRKVPSDAMVLLTNEQPGAYWYLLPVYGILAVFAGLFMWALVRALRRDGDDDNLPAPAV